MPIFGDLLSFWMNFVFRKLCQEIDGDIAFIPVHIGQGNLGTLCGP